MIFDGNMQIDTMGTILELCKKYHKPGTYLQKINFVIDNKIEKNYPVFIYL